MENTTTISLSDRELQVVIEGLGKLTAEKSFGIILKLQATYAANANKAKEVEEISKENEG